MKILVSDFDNTFYTSEFEQNKKAVKDFVSKGNLFVIATGRNLKYLLSDLKIGEVPVSYYICNDGASIYDQNYTLIYQKNINQDIVSELFEALKNNHSFDSILIDCNGDYVIDTKRAANKIIAKPIDVLATKEFENIQKKFPTIKGYFSENWLNIMDEAVDKGNAIEILKRQNNWPTDTIYTIGDSENDIFMNAIYQGYAMKNSIEELKKVSIKTVSNIRELITIIDSK